MKRLTKLQMMDLENYLRDLKAYKAKMTAIAMAEHISFAVGFRVVSSTLSKVLRRIGRFDEFIQTPADSAPVAPVTPVVAPEPVPTDSVSHETQLVLDEIRFLSTALIDLLDNREAVEKERAEQKREISSLRESIVKLQDSFARLKDGSVPAPKRLPMMEKPQGGERTNGHHAG